MFCIQALDHEEGTGARWFELKGTQRPTRKECRMVRRSLNSDCLYSYRIVKVDSPEYYAQPTDALEY